MDTGDTMVRPWDELERRTRKADSRQRVHVHATWTSVRVESAEYDERGEGATRAWVRLGELAPADVEVALVTPSRGECQMWCEQSYHNGSFAYTASAACVAEDAEDAEDAESLPEMWVVRVTPAPRWTGAVDLPPVVCGVARVTFESGPARVPGARTRCGA
jgi:hypothetical protein